MEEHTMEQVSSKSQPNWRAVVGWNIDSDLVNADKSDCKVHEK